MQDQLHVDVLVGSSASTNTSAAASPNGTSSATSCFGKSCAASASAETVAERLKKKVAHTCNGTSSRCENGYSAWPAPVATSTCNVKPISVDLRSGDRELIRIIAQYLKSLGLSETVRTLTSESGCNIENPLATKFRKDIVGGRWLSALNVLPVLKGFLKKQRYLNEMQFLIYKQKYLELLYAGKVLDALMVLRDEISPLKFGQEKVQQLTCFASGWRKASSNPCKEGVAVSRNALMEKLQRYLPASIILPPRRLEVLIHQAVELQWKQCRYHNVSGQPSMSRIGLDSLLTNHVCSSNAFPVETVQVLSDHCDEVWFCSFSNHGRQLATGSKDGVVIIWDVDLTTKRLVRRFSLEGHVYGASYFAWSPDDSLLAVVGSEESSDLWIWKLEDGSLLKKVTHSPEESISCVSWLVDGQRLVCGGTKGQFYLTDVSGNIVETWEGIRIRVAHCKRDGSNVLAADTHNRIRSYCFEDLVEKTIVKEESSLIYFCMDKMEKYALCTVARQGLHLWDLSTGTLVRRYRGAGQGYYTIFSCFGGVDERYLASGSEEGNVYVWQKELEEAIVILKGHSNVVNATSWNPVDPSMLASCSDDGTVRIWGPTAFARKRSTL